MLEAQLRDQSGAISWEKYQDLAGNVLRGSLDDRIGCVLTKPLLSENDFSAGTSWYGTPPVQKSSL